MRIDGCTVLITGASAGLGREFAQQLAPRAGVLILVARRVERLEQLRDELLVRHQRLKVHVRAADLSQPDEVNELSEWLDRDGIAVNLLINNAGLGDRGQFTTSKPERVADILQVNVAALTMLTRALLPGMRDRKRGTVLNVSSCASFLPMPAFAVYAASKAYVTSFSEALAGELRGSGVSVTALCPGPVHTEFDTVALRPDEPAQKAPEFTYVPASDVVRCGIDAIERERPVAIPGFVMKAAVAILRLTPMPLLRLGWRFAR